MKQLFLILALVLLHSAAGAQYEKLDELYQSGDYEKCLKKAERQSDRNSQEIEPYFYMAMCYFEQYKQADQKRQQELLLKKTLRYAFKATRRDDKGIVKEKFSEQFQDIQKTTHSFAEKLYSDDADDSKYFFDHLVKIYSDTTQQFLELNGLVKQEKEDNSNSNSSAAFTLEDIQKQQLNRVDENGVKQGVWKKVYPNGKPAYEVFFRNGKPVGEYKRYHRNGKLKALLNYDENGEHATAQLFDDSGNLIAEGFYFGQKKDSVWHFYSVDKNLARAEGELKNLRVKPGKIRYIVAEEKYDKGQETGVWKSFYPSGVVAQTIEWADGKENGDFKQFHPNGKPKMEAKMKDGKRHGLVFFYYPNGSINVHGYYYQDKRHGKWTYYSTKGKEDKVIEYEYGEIVNGEKLEDEETEQLRKFEENRHKLKDPEKYINNPDAYIRGF